MASFAAAAKAPKNVTLRPIYPMYQASKPVLARESHTSINPNVMPVYNKANGQLASHVTIADGKAIQSSIEAAVRAEPAMAALPSYKRKDILQQMVRGLEERQQELATVLAIEVGKPIKDAIVEVGRAIDTLSLAANEAINRKGEFAHLDISARNAGFTSITDRFPVGLISMVVPFNFPVNLAAHKIGPAIAAGCPFILKPSDRTPISATILGEIMEKTELPVGAFSILPTTLEHAHHFSADPRIKLLSFTGSAEVGWKLKASSGKKKVTLELGGNAACIIDGDTKDLDHVADRIIFGSFYQSGQSCISVQRILAHENIYEPLKQKLIERAKTLKKGDPLDPATFLGPMITENDAIRVERWVNNAGGKVLVGGGRDGSYYDATIVECGNPQSDLYRKEVFGPVCVLDKFSDFKTAINTVNDSDFGLQAGIFTQDIHKAFYAFRNLAVGGVIINDIPSARVDSQPYGGVKESGVGREGIRYAIEDFTEIRIMSMKNIGTSL
jgi:acyl-CoA reductase-like NAD-dependent aldehyde dehydrogenase